MLMKYSLLILYYLVINPLLCKVLILIKQINTDEEVNVFPLYYVTITEKTGLCKLGGSHVGTHSGMMIVLPRRRIICF